LGDILGDILGEFFYKLIWSHWCAAASASETKSIWFIFWGLMEV
jgi:hypothetical protein